MGRRRGARVKNGEKGQALNGRQQKKSYPVAFTAALQKSPPIEHTLNVGRV
jgi:hypothetical protein